MYIYIYIQLTSINIIKVHSYPSLNPQRKPQPEQRGAFRRFVQATNERSSHLCGQWIAMVENVEMWGESQNGNQSDG